jgi:hypothetical protein
MNELRITMKKMFYSQFKHMILVLLIFVASFSRASAEEAPSKYDVIIVGGGVAGTYCGWRLLKNAPPVGSEAHQLASARENGQLKVCLFEYSNRIGGRLFSVKLPEYPDLCAELGGMRFTAGQESVSGLCNYLGLERFPFLMGTEANFYYLRGVKFFKSQLENPAFNLPFRVQADARGKSPNDIIWSIILKVCPTIDLISSKERAAFLQTCEYNGKPLWQTGFWNLLLDHLDI